jgi:hypothetical protein
VPDDADCLPRTAKNTPPTIKIKAPALRSRLQKNSTDQWVSLPNWSERPIDIVGEFSRLPNWRGLPSPAGKNGSNDPAEFLRIGVCQMVAMLTADCGRCSAKLMTHDVLSGVQVGAGNWELFVVCRACRHTTIWQVMSAHELLSYNGTVDHTILGKELIRPKGAVVSAPEHTPPELKSIFNEGAECAGNKTWNAAGAMFRKVLDQISKDKMNAAPIQPPDKHTRYNLKPRLAWLFANGLLPKELETLAAAIREDGNDGAHNAPLGEADALDLQDFAVEVLETLFTLPGRLKDAEDRREKRRGGT